jgi:glycosyltransferase involved in cell wall biosynthesis
MLAGGSNGQAKQLVLSLLRHMPPAADDMTFVLLTREATDPELASLDTDRVSRRCVLRESVATPPPAVHRGRALRSRVRRYVPARLRRLARRGLDVVRSRPSPNPLVRELQPDLLFFPFTAPEYYDPGVPVVAQVHDVQFADYPQFFTEKQRSVRERDFNRACAVSDRLICTSESLRRRVLEIGHASPEHVVTISPGLLQDVAPPEPIRARAVLSHYHLKQDHFLLYPANFWPHSNHAMLLTAFGLFCRRHPDSDLVLVCAGQQDHGMERVRRAAARIGIEHRVVLPGYLADAARGALVEGCRALVYPSLYEGSGLPIVEALAAGKPVLCSSLTSLREVGGDAARYFDPRKPEDIVTAIENVAGAPRTVHDAPRIEDASTVAARYLSVFREALSIRRSHA